MDLFFGMGCIKNQQLKESKDMHYPMIVVGKYVEEKMDQFSADCEDCMEFIDETEQVKEDYASGKVEAVRTSDGVAKLKSQVKNYDGMSIEKIPFNEIFSTEEEFAKEWYNYEVEDGRYGYYSNPNAICDWYVIGGRFTEWFVHVKNPKYPDDILKCDNVKRNHDRSCEAVRKCDLDIKALKKFVKEQAIELWNKYSNDRYKTTYGIYENETKEEYVSRKEKNFLFTMSVVADDGSLIEYSSNEDGLRDFMEFFESLPDDALLTIVDYHN